MNLYESIKKNLKESDEGRRKKQLINNIEALLYGYDNNISDGYSEPFKSDEEMIEYVYSQVFDLKDDGMGNTRWLDGVCDDLKYLGKDYIIDEIKRIGNEAGVVQTEEDYKNEATKQIEHDFGKSYVNATKESEDDKRFVEVDYKSVVDSDGFTTEYTWYKDKVNNTNVFVFGDRDIYKPTDGDYDWQEENDEAAKEWFDSFEGFNESDKLDEFENRDIDKLRKDYFGNNLDLYSQPEEVRDEINRKDFFLAKDFNEVLEDYENNPDSDWYIDIIKAAQNNIVTRKEREVEKEAKAQYKRDKKRLSELRKQHSTRVDLIDLLFNRIKDYESKHNINEAEENRYIILKKLEDIISKVEKLDFGDIEGTKRYGKVDSIKKANSEFDDIIKEMNKFIKDNNITQDEFNQVSEVYRNSFDDIVYPKNFIPKTTTKENVEEHREIRTPRSNPYDRTKAAVYATGNRWAIENFNATHN